MRMLSSSVRLFTKFSTRRLSNLVPKNQFSCVNRYYTKYSKYYGGFTVSDIEMKRINALKETMKIPAVNSQYSSDNYLNGFKKQLQTLADPVKKYDHLMALREQDINLYYNFLCNNTSEVLTILYAVDNIIQKYRRLLVGQKLSQVLMKETKKKPLKPLDPPDTIEYLKKRIREIKKRESEKVKKVVKSSASWIKRPLMISPEKCLMVYLKTN